MSVFSFLNVPRNVAVQLVNPTVVLARVIKAVELLLHFLVLRYERKSKSSHWRRTYAVDCKSSHAVEKGYAALAVTGPSRKRRASADGMLARVAVNQALSG